MVSWRLRSKSRGCRFRVGSFLDDGVFINQHWLARGQWKLLRSGVALRSTPATRPVLVILHGLDSLRSLKAVAPGAALYPGHPSIVGDF